MYASSGGHVSAQLPVCHRRWLYTYKVIGLYYHKTIKLSNYRTIGL